MGGTTPPRGFCLRLWISGCAHGLRSFRFANVRLRHQRPCCCNLNHAQYNLISALNAGEGSVFVLEEISATSIATLDGDH
jgi:hypothetical protein